MTEGLKIISHQVLDELTQQARVAERKRKNLNLHDDYADPCQRLFNALEPETYIRPHRHTRPAKPECFMAVRGRMVLLLFAEDGQVTTAIAFGDGSDVVAIEVPAGTWHAIISLEAGSMFFETKPGPYAPLADKDFAPWAPPEGSAEVKLYLQRLVARAKEILVV